MKKTSSKTIAAAPKGILVIISAPSGCGKTTIIDRLLKRNQDWIRSVSATTRAPRSSEKAGEDYFFMSMQDFQRMQKEGQLLESAQVFDHWYGTPKTFVSDRLNEEKIILLAIDVQGFQKVKQEMKSAKNILSIFVLPPSIKVLRERLEARQTEAPEQIEKRIEIAQEEIKGARLYDHTVVNQNLEQTVVEMEDLIKEFYKNYRHSSNPKEK